MVNNFDLSNLALQSVLPNNEMLFDDKGKPSVMVKIPKMTYAQLGLGDSTDVFPAFIINGVTKDALWISKYQNIVMDGRAYSLPGKDPKTGINFESAIAACTAKGAGWHLMTRMEWAMLAHWCKKNGTMPKGNNNNGKDTSETIYRAIPTYYDSGKVGRVATGTGPVTWSHDGTPAGIWDLNGNVSEWVGGMRLVYGELQIIANNDAAMVNANQGASSDAWKAIDATTGLLIAPNGTGTTTNSIKLDYVSSHWQWDTTISSSSDSSRNCSLESVTCSENISAAAQAVLQALGLFKYDATSGAYGGDYLYANNGAAERSFYCGGYWGLTGFAGVFFAYGFNARSTTNAAIGFRSAFYEA